jgi:hypothetical protein
LLFSKPDVPVSAHREYAERKAGIVIVEIAIVALFADMRLYNCVPANFILAQMIAAIAIHGVSVVALLLALNDSIGAGGTAREVIRTVSTACKISAVVGEIVSAGNWGNDGAVALLASTHDAIAA